MQSGHAGTIPFHGRRTTPCSGHVRSPARIRTLLQSTAVITGPYLDVQGADETLNHTARFLSDRAFPFIPKFPGRQLVNDLTPHSTIFGREPAVLIGAVAASLAVIIGFVPDALTTEQAGAITAFLTAAAAVWTAVKVRPLAPTLFTGVITTGATLLATFGTHLSQSQVGALAAASVALMTALVVRPQSTPVSNPRDLA